jgi:hypothetical protein
MSNTAHTREIADLKNAGLNPILSSKNAGAPTGAVQLRFKFSLILTIFNDSGFRISLTSLSNHQSISNRRAIGFGIIRSLCHGTGAAAASALASVYGAKKSARSSEANARAQRAWQTENGKHQGSHLKGDAQDQQQLYQRGVGPEQNQDSKKGGN